MTASATEPSLRFLRLQRATLFAAAAAAFTAVAIGSALPFWALAGFLGAWFAGLIVRELPWRLFGNAVNLATVAGVFAVLAPGVVDRDRLPVAASEAALMLCANRLLVRRTAADDAMLHLSCWLVLASGAALTGELAYGLCLLAYAALAAVSMTLAELRRGIEEEAPLQAHSLLAAPELTSRRLWFFSASLGLFSAGFGLFVFPLFPRMPLGFSHGLGGGLPRTGVSDRVDLSAAGTLTDSSRVVLHAELRGKTSAARYWRAATLDEFTGRGWLPGQPPSRTVRSVERRGWSEPQLVGDFELFTDSSQLIPVPQGLVSLFPRPSGSWLRESPEGDLHVAAGSYREKQFTFEAGGVSGAAPSALTLSRALQLPKLSPELEALARELVPDGTDPEAAIARVSGYLSRFTYSRELHASDKPLDDFLQRRAGHCELFATAVAILLRARGVPTRYVAGYYASDPDASPLTLRDWDAHAWAEVLVPGQGFVLVDATPPELRGASLEHTRFWQKALDLWGGAQVGWLRGIVDFDTGAQEQSAGWLANRVSRSFRALRSKSKEARLIALGLVLLLLLPLAARRLVNRDSPAVRLEKSFFRALERQGTPRGPTDTYEEALARVRERNAGLAERAAPLAARLGAARFGGRPLGAGEARALRARIERLG